MLPYPRTRAYDTNAAESFTDILILVMRPPPEVINVKVLDRRSASLSFFILPLSLSLSLSLFVVRFRARRILNMNQADRSMEEFKEDRGILSN